MNRDTCKHYTPGDLLCEKCEMEAMHLELASLRHDIEHAVQRNTELLAENESLRAEKERAEQAEARYNQLLTKMQEEGNIPYGN